MKRLQSDALVKTLVSFIPRNSLPQGPLMMRRNHRDAYIHANDFLRLLRPFASLEGRYQHESSSCIREWIAKTNVRVSAR